MTQRNKYIITIRYVDDLTANTLNTIALHQATQLAHITKDEIERSHRYYQDFHVYQELICYATPDKIEKFKEALTSESYIYEFDIKIEQSSNGKNDIVDVFNLIFGKEEE